MGEYLLMLFVGAFVCVLGVLNARGHIESLHWYHRRRVLPEDVKPFGRLVGSGTVIIGVSLVLCSVVYMLAKYFALDFLYIVGLAEVIVSVVVGLALIFFAMIKYNKGIF